MHNLLKKLSNFLIIKKKKKEKKVRAFSEPHEIINKLKHLKINNEKT